MNGYYTSRLIETVRYLPTVPEGNYRHDANGMRPIFDTAVLMQYTRPLDVDGKSVNIALDVLYFPA